MYSFFMDTSHGNTNSRIKIYFKNVIFSKIFTSFHYKHCFFDGQELAIKM